MISVEEALQILDSHTVHFGSEIVDLDEANGRILEEDVFADRPFPPFHRVTMDGIAIRYATYGQGRRAFAVEQIAAAGAPQCRLMDQEACIEVMTGAILPEGVDTVIRYEDIRMDESGATIFAEVRLGQNIHRCGEDHPRGARLIPAGTLLSAAEIGVAATVGRSRVKVARLPRVLLVSTGNELVNIDQQPQPHQIRKSNVYRIAATLKAMGLKADLLHLQDDYESILTHLGARLDKYDVMLLSGGVSKGKYDYLPEALDALGVVKHFHRIAQRPGKPLWFGSRAGGPVVFAFPGNPISSFLCTHAYFIPWLQKSLGFPQKQQPHAVLSETIEFKPDLTYYLEVSLEYRSNGTLYAIPRQGHGSGDLANLMRADAFIKLPRGQEVYPAGGTYPVYPFR
ncbi:MAG: molybdopterin molybdotransferase MoeA [Saprospiraceae bacterium]|nr:molybdopterin molybdotransferase MoeA [Saprospiraceae bacterium]